MTTPVTIVRKQQCEWAQDRGIALDSDGYTLSLSDNLFSPLSASTEEEFLHGDGKELGKPGKRGKMQALHSSSALTCNFFDYWRGRDTSALAYALGLTSSILEISFEKKCPTGLRGNAPNLDVVLHLSAGSIIAIESKFLEPYSAHGPGFNAKYFESAGGLWGRLGYQDCQILAEKLHSGDRVFRWLYAEQLLKHILGLARSKDPWRLLYLWYEVQGPETIEHALEADEFARVIRADDIDFETMSYQVLFKSLQNHVGDGDREYIDYMGNRYFLTTPSHC